MMKSRKAQVAVEFLMLIVLLFSIFMIYTIGTRNKMDEIRDQKEYALLADVARMAQNEILTASRVEDGYYRTFELPETLDGVNYTIGIVSMMIQASTENHEYILAIPTVNGTVKKGDNVITKENGIIKIQ
jgi:uncharacterized protein (UPF0333 family)